MICFYGCEKEAIYQFKNGKWCCSKHRQKCNAERERNKIRSRGEGNPMFGRIGEKNPFYNKKHSSKSKELMSINNAAKRPEVRKKMSDSAKERIKKFPIVRNDTKGSKNGMYGKKHSIETKKIWSLKRKGIFSGEKNPNWKGGISCEPYCFEWSFRDFKDFIKERDGYKCLNPCCNRNYLRVCLHHIDYNKKNCCPNNLITLCVSCNSKANTNREWHESWYKAIVLKRDY